MKNAPIYVTRSSLPPLEEYIEALQEIWDSACLTNMGPQHRRFEKKAAEYLAVDYLTLFTNGHLALDIAIKALGLSGEVITTPFTFISTAHAITQNNLKAVFCDIRPDDYTLDATKLENLINEKTSAILPVHVYGNICNMAAIDTIAKKYALKVIYDAAHAFGIKVADRGIGTFGDVSMFSFHATKVFHTIEGGALTYSNSGFRKKFDCLKNFGIVSEEQVEEVGANAKMSELQAAMGICNLKYLDGEIGKRKTVVERYREWLESVPGIQLNREIKGITPNYAYFPVVIEPKIFGKSRDQIFNQLATDNIHARKYFYPLINDLACYRGVYSSEQTPVAKKIASQVITLPLFGDLQLQDVDRICGHILA